jgi:hypothetical protein
VVRLNRRRPELPRALLDSASGFQFAALLLGAPHWARLEELGRWLLKHLGLLSATVVVFPAA